MYFLIGADQVNKFRDWKDAKELSNLARITFVNRPGFDLETVKKMYTEGLIFVEGNSEDISSTQIRKAIRDKDEKAINELMCEEEISYIKNNQIFDEI